MQYLFVHYGRFQLVALLALSFVVSCNQQEAVGYRAEVEQGLSEARVDELIEGIHIGMTREEFHELAATANREQRFTNGSGTSIRTDLPEGYFGAHGSLEFFPRFEDGLVSGMDGRIYFDDWAPGRKDAQADVLLEKSLDYYRDLFPGAAFKKFEETARPTYYKIDGNRRVALYPHRLRYVVFEVVDLTTASEDVLSGEDLRTPNDPFYRLVPETE